jgi:hypothetical protein
MNVEGTRKCRQKQARPREDNAIKQPKVSSVSCTRRFGLWRHTNGAELAPAG